MSEYRYEAFISYRHLSPDREIAADICKLLEKYVVPHSVRKIAGRKRLTKLFRDQEELPLSPDLGTSIEDALVGSKWLIVVCSEKLRESVWCMKEVETFVALGRRDRIICVLAGGEPEVSFPPILLTEIVDGVPTPREPFAADVRADTLSAMRARLRREKLRLIAPMLGLGYDDLKRRQRERTLKRAVTLSAAAAVLLGAFLAYAVVQSGKIERARTLAAGNEAQLLVEKSLLYSKNNDKPAARDMALTAYDVTQTIGGQYEESALSALAAACYSGDIDTLAALETGGARVYSLTFSQDGELVAGIANQNTAVVFDAQTGKLLFRSPDPYHPLDAVTFSPDGGRLLTICASQNTLKVYDLAEGACVNTFQSSSTSAYDLCDADFISDSELLVWTSDAIRGWTYESDMWRDFIIFDSASSDTKNVSENISALYGSSLFLDSARKQIAFPNQNGTGNVVLLDAVTGEIHTLSSGLKRGISNMAFSEDATLLACDTTRNISVFDVHGGKLAYSIDLDGRNCRTLAFSHGGHMLVCATDTDIRSYDAETGALIYTAGAISDVLDGNVIFSPDDKYLFVSATPKAIYTASTGDIAYDLAPHGLHIQAVSPTGAVLLTSDGGTGNYLNNMLGFGTQETVAEYQGELFSVPSWSPLKRDATLNNPFYDSAPFGNYLQQRMFVSPDGRFAVLINDGTYIKIWDLDAGDDVLYCLYEHTFGGATQCNDIAFTQDCARMATAGQDGRCVIFDLERGEIMRVVEPSAWQTTIEKVTFNQSGDKVMTRNFANTVFHVYSVTDGALLYRLTAQKPVSAFGFDKHSGDAVVLYADGSALIGRLFDSQEVLLAFARGEALKEP